MHSDRFWAAAEQVETHMNATGFSFLRNEANEKEGLGNAGIEIFRDDPYASVARECGQNSNDAARARPVIISFDTLSVSTADLPGYEDLTNAIDACLAAAQSDKERQFFDRARTVLASATIPVLHIADYSTTGLEGPPDEPGTPFHSLVKGSGVSAKYQTTSGGSFGIGKNACYAVSELRTVFYSTRYIDVTAKAECFAAQGKAILVSHLDAKNEARRATGYWGVQPGCQPLTDPDQAPEWLRREGIGTSIFCVGFRPQQQWDLRIAYSVLANFFAAIHFGQLAFKIAGEHFLINSNTLYSMFSDDAIKTVAEKAGKAPNLDLARQFYECLVSVEATDNSLTLSPDHMFKIRILVRDKLPKRVGILRNGMLVATDLREFGDKLERFAGCKDFVAIVEPSSPIANELLRELENPKHNGFSAERIDDPQKQDRAAGLMRALRTQIRDTIKAIAQVKSDAETSLEELSEFFADNSKHANNKPKSAENDVERYILKPPRRQPPRQIAIRTSSPDSDDANAGVGGSGGGSSGSGKAGGSDGTSGGGQDEGHGKGRPSHGTSVELRHLRVLFDGPDARRRTICFTSDRSCRIRLGASATGMISREPLAISVAAEADVKGDRVELEVREGERVALKVQFAEPYSGPIDIDAFSVP